MGRHPRHLLSTSPSMCRDISIGPLVFCRHFEAVILFLVESADSLGQFLTSIRPSFFFETVVVGSSPPPLESRTHRRGADFISILSFKPLSFSQSRFDPVRDSRTVNSYGPLLTLAFAP